MDVVDTLLDRTVVAGYSRVGLLLRQRLPGWPDEALDLEGKRVVVTGATSGIGRAAAGLLSGHGAEVVVVGRDAERTQEVAEQIGATAAVCDVSRLSSLRSFTEQWRGELDVLVNNAGVMPPTRTLTEDGVELAFATNVLGPWWLTGDLARHLRPGGRVINVSSGGMYGQRLDRDLQNEDYRPAKAYARTKRAEVVLTEMWSVRLAAKGIVVHAMHPGWALTPGVETSLPRFRQLLGPVLRTPEEGADTIVWLAGAAAPGACTGRFWHDRRERPTHLFGLHVESDADRQRLWDELVAIAGEPSWG